MTTELIEQLREFLISTNLSTYCINAYLTLVTSSDLNAKEISRRSKVPIGRVYEILDELESSDSDDLGSKVIDSLHYPEEEYVGDYLQDAPDLLFLPATGFGRFTEYEFSSNKLLSIPRGISGTHRLQGLFMLKGNGILKSTSELTTCKSRAVESSRETMSFGLRSIQSQRGSAGPSGCRKTSMRS